MHFVKGVDNEQLAYLFQDFSILFWRLPGVCLRVYWLGQFVPAEATPVFSLPDKTAGASGSAVLARRTPKRRAGRMNLLMIPHTAALTRECVVRVSICAAQGIVDHLSGRRPEFVFNRAVLD